MSYVMVRGSVPIFWDQRGVYEEIAYPKTPEMTTRPFRKHFTDLIDYYGDIFVVDLLSDTTARELPLTSNYIRNIYECPKSIRDRLGFQHFDFHGFCKGDKYMMLKVLLTRLNEGFTTHGYLIEDLSMKKTLKTQTGVFRVNCLDSLDRTNVA